MAALEVTAREVARKPLVAMLGDWSPAWLATVAAIAGAVVFVSSRRQPGRLGRLAHAPLLFAVIYSAGVAAQIGLNARLQSDGFYYFAYLRSMAFDGDVEFSNDYRLLGLGDKTHLFQPTPTNHAQSAWTIGPAILWSPFFAASHLVARDLAEHDGNVTTNGISFPYRQSVCIAGLVYGLLGCWFLYRVSLRVTDRPIAAAASTVTVCGSFMLWYMVKEPSMTHAPSMALVAGFVWAWLATREQRTTWHWVGLGLLAGVMTLVRWQNALFALLPACDSAVALYRAWRHRDGRLGRNAVVTGVLFTAAATVAFVPQMLAWKAIYGSFLAVSPVGPQIRFGDPHIVDILWSSRNGLFSTSPALAAGAVGLLLFARSLPSIGIPCLLAVAAMVYFNACVQDWWGSAGYGGRRFDGTLAIFVLGVAYLGHVSVEFIRRFPSVTVGAAALLLVLWNVTQVAIAQAGILRIGESVSFGDTMSAQARQFHSWFGNPFTYPMTLAYSLRNGVSPGRADLLIADRFLSDPLRPYARIDMGGGDAWLIEEGWHAAEREGAMTFRWASQPAAFVIPLDHAATLRVQFRVHAFNFPQAPGQTMTMVVNGHAHGPVPIQPDWHVVEFMVDRSVWRRGLNRATLEFGRANRPSDLGLGGDTRVLTAAFDFFRVLKE